MNVFELTKALVNIPSPTGTEGALADFLAGLLRERGFSVLEQDVEPGRRNLFATLDPPPRIVFCTHMDTVPGLALAAEDDRYIRGRGACDAKGIMAALITAASDLLREGRRDLGLLFVVGEETDSRGAKAANALAASAPAARGPRYLIVGEPTENVLGRGHLGILTVALSTSGRRAHSAFPHLGESAVEKLLDVLSDVRLLDFGSDPVLGPTRMSIVQISGGEAPNVIPDAARAVVSLRTGVAPDGLLEMIAGAAGGRAGLEVISKSDPQTLHTVPGFECGVMPFGSDIPHLKAFGTPLLVGPGSALDAHTADEKIEKRQLLDAVRIYGRLVRALAGAENR
jgi:acetylornithine deacetylase